MLWERKGYKVGNHILKKSCKLVVCNKDYSYMIYGYVKFSCTLPIFSLESYTSQISMFFFSCDPVVEPKGYRNEPDLSKPYPNCCVNLVKIY